MLSPVPSIDLVCLAPCCLLAGCLAGVQLEALDNLQQLVQVEVSDRLPGTHTEHVLASQRVGLGGVGGAAHTAGAVQRHGDMAAPGQRHLDMVGVGGGRRQGAVFREGTLIHLGQEDYSWAPWHTKHTMAVKKKGQTSHREVARKVWYKTGKTYQEWSY